MTLLVTGAKGFIGKNMMYRLNIHQVTGLDDDYFSELTWPDYLQNFLDAKKPTAVFHMGACSDTLELDANYMMTRNYESTKIITDWCTKNKIPIVYSSSAASYGENGEYPSNLYGWSKYVAEDYVVKSGGIALRYFNVYGPGEEHKKEMASVAYKAFLKKESNEPNFLFPKKPQRDFVYVKDVVHANIHAWLNYDSLYGEAYDVGSGEPRGFEDVLELMNISYEYCGEEMIPKGYQFYTCSDRNKWMRGWEPYYTLEKGLEDYISYLK